MSSEGMIPEFKFPTFIKDFNDIQNTHCYCGVKLSEDNITRFDDGSIPFLGGKAVCNDCWDKAFRFDDDLEDDEG